LAELVAAGWFQFIFTPNFDHLIEDALRAKGVDHVIITHDEIVTTRAPGDERPAVFKLHGDYLFTTIRTSTPGTRMLETKKRELFAQTLSTHGLIVVGYAGNDDSIMVPLKKALKTRGELPYGLIWVIREGAMPSARVTELLKTGGDNACVIEYRDSDGFFHDLLEHLCHFQPDEHRQGADPSEVATTFNRTAPTPLLSLEEVLQRARARPEDFNAFVQAYPNSGYFQQEGGYHEGIVPRFQHFLASRQQNKDEEQAANSVQKEVTQFANQALDPSFVADDERTGSFHQQVLESMQQILEPMKSDINNIVERLEKLEKEKAEKQPSLLARLRRKKGKGYWTA
jgi:hypothetical protein